MESKVGIIPHRSDKPKQSLRDIGTCKQKLVSEYLLYFENFAYNDTFYSNNRKIFQHFETCKDLFTLHNGTVKPISLGIATIIFTLIQLPLDAVVDKFNKNTDKRFWLVTCENTHYIINR